MVKSSIEREGKIRRVLVGSKGEIGYRKSSTLTKVLVQKKREEVK